MIVYVWWVSLSLKMPTLLARQPVLCTAGRLLHGQTSPVIIRDSTRAWGFPWGFPWDFHGISHGISMGFCDGILMICFMGLGFCDGIPQIHPKLRQKPGPGFYVPRFHINYEGEISSPTDMAVSVMFNKYPQLSGHQSQPLWVQLIKSSPLGSVFSHSMDWFKAKSRPETIDVPMMFPGNPRVCPFQFDLQPIELFSTSKKTMIFLNGSCHGLKNLGFKMPEWTNFP